MAIKDYNRGEVNKGQVFHFEHSLRPFIIVEDGGEDVFLDIDTWEIFDFETLENNEGLYFYEKEEDEDFKGVDVVCTIKEWFK